MELVYLEIVNSTSGRGDLVFSWGVGGLISSPAQQGHLREQGIQAPCLLTGEQTLQKGAFCTPSLYPVQ